MASNPDVSIVICCFMQEHYLDKAYWSAKSQEFDGTIEVVVSHDNCIEGKGTNAAHNRNAGIQRARGTYVVCLDADDMLPVNYVQAMHRRITLAQARRGGNALKAFVGCPVQFISGPKLMRFDSRPPTCLPAAGLSELEMSAVLTSGIPVSAMFQRYAWLKEQQFDESAAMAAMEDTDFWAGLLCRGYEYLYTTETIQLRTNDGGSYVHRVGSAKRKAALDLINARYSLNITFPEVI